MPIVDAHAHITSRQFDDDRDAMLQRAWDAGLVAIVEAGDDVRSGQRALALARRDPRVHAVTGLHPHSASRLPEERDALAALIASGEYLGVGEIGLDFFRNLSPQDAQYEAFRWQLDLAREHTLPVVIHSRDADAECFGVLAAWADRVGRYLGPDREVGMLHCFAGDAALAQAYIDLGFLISIPGPVTYKGNDRTQQVAREIPLRAILVETDAPYLAPVPHRGSRNEPAYVAETARLVAGLRACAVEDVTDAAAHNTARLFGFTI